MTELVKNAPLVQAIFEVRFPGEPAVESRRDAFYELIRDEFPKVFVPRIREGESPALKPYVFKNESETEELNTAINRFSLITFQYPGFQAFKAHFLQYFRLFAETYRIKKLNRTGLRYINHIPILWEKGIIPISNYLNFGYKLPSSIPEAIEEFGTFFTVNVREGKLRILVEYQEREDPLTPEIIVLDFDYFLRENLTVERIEEYLESSHAHTKRVFLDLTPTSTFR